MGKNKKKNNTAAPAAEHDQNQENSNTDEAADENNPNSENNNEENNDNNNEENNDGNNNKSNNNNDNNKGNNNKNTKGNNNNNNNNNKQNAGAIVLGVYLHCQGCVETVVKSLRGFDGVEIVEPNTKDHRVTVKGKGADPVKVAERVRRKTGKHVEIISPVQKKQQEKKAEKKPEAPKVIESVLKVHLHCEGCAKDIKHCILKMEGVQTVNVDMNASHVTVKGTFDPKNLVAFISKRAGRYAEIVNPKNKQNQNKNNKNEGDEKKDNEKEKKDKDKDGKNIGLSYPNVPPGLVYAPQIFSDENPNACSIL